MDLICLSQMVSGYLLLGGDGDLDLPPSFDASPESLLLGVLEAEQAVLAKYAGLCSKPIIPMDLISVGE